MGYRLVVVVELQQLFLDHNNTLIALAGGGGGGAAVENYQSDGRPGGVSRSGHGSDCTIRNPPKYGINGTSGENTALAFPKILGESSSFLKVFAGGGGGITANPNNQASEIHSEYIVGKSAEEGGHGGYHPSESFSYQGLLECIPNPQTSFDVPCPTIKTKDISRGGSGYSGGGAGSPWLMDVPRKDNFCTEVMWDYFGGGGGGGGFNGGGAGDRERGGGGGSSYLLPNFFDTALLEGSYVNNPRNGFIQFRVNYDLENPDAVCQDTTVTLGYGNYYTGIAGEINFGNGVSGKVTLDPNAIDGGSTDNGAIASIAASQTEFTCADLGQNEVTLTVTDAMGLTATCTAIVTVIDDHAPGLSLESHNLISSPTFGHIDLGNNSSLRVNPPTLTFVDNCAVYSPSIQQAEPFTVTCNDIGKTFVKEVRASDISGNERVFYLNYSITATPKAYGRNITRSLNNSGTVTITPQDILDTALSGDCDIFNYSLDKTSFNCDDVGENEVTLTVTNTLTNESDSTTVTVTIEPFSTFFKILYVDANSPAETGNGYSWSQAFKTLDQALAIQKCMDIDEIRVASGVYYPSTSRGCENCSSAREYYFLMNTDFELRGSYNPSTGLQDYNSPSILNGDLGVIGDLTDNAYHVLMTQGLTEQAIIDGFVIQNGNASGTSNITVASFSNPPYQGNGGGIYNDMSNAIFSNVYLYNNSANNGGGGMINMFESPKLVNVVFANNHSNTNGGGLYNYFSGPTLINNTIYGNTAIEGGGVYNDHNVSESVVPTFHNTVLYNNGSDITNYLTIINDNSSHNFSENYTGNGFESLSESPFIDSFNFIGDDFIAGTIDDGLVPSLISPLINAGNNVHNSLNTDITGNDRFNDDIIDVGAYEYNNCLTYASGVIYVDANASGANNGSSWADALISLDEALIEAKSCNSIAEILVAGGVYKPNTSRGCTDCTTAREAYFLIDQDIILKGGYNPATGEIDFNTPTILSGDIGSDSNSDNVYHVLITQGLTAKSVIDGFNIVDGNANGIGSNFINSVSLLKNYGGGIYNMNSSPTFQNIVVSNNASSFAGGGIYNQNNSHSKFVNSIISGNKSGSGGGMHNTQSSPTLINLTVVGNTAPSGGGGIFNFTSASPLIHNSVFFNNGADITYFNSLVNSNSSNNFSSNYGGTGFSILNSSPFVDSDNALGLDGLWRTADDGLNPALGGILINMGSNTAYIDAGGSLINDTDIAGNARIYDDSSLELDKIDVGAYEYSSDLLVYKADFTVSSTSGCGLPQSVTFTDKSEKPDTWEWDFGDGNTSTEQNPIHTYTEEGEYTVTLKVTNTKYNTSDTHTKLVAIEVASVDFTTGTPSDCTPYAITFEDASSFSGDGNITAWLWDFGNGNTSTLQNPVHTYTDSGDYSVSLTISTSTGCNFTKTRSVEVRDKLTASFAVTDASCSPTNDGAIDLSVTGGAPPYKFEWSNLASTEDLSNLSKGTYSVKITDASGCSTNAVVTVDSSNDVTPPVPDLVTLPNITAECEVTGLTAPRATDNCASVVTVTHDAVLPIVTQGTTVVTWTYDDGNGNSSTQIQNVIIDDTTAPVPDVVSLPNVTAQCEVTSLNPPTATDNCGGPVTITSNATLPITTQGTTVITWFYDDGNGNITAQNQNIVIQDNTNPIIRAKSGITLKVDALSTAELTPAMIDEGSTDNCGILSQTFNKTSFTKADEGLNNVVYTVTDMNGNSSQVNIVVIVEVVSKILTITVNPGQSKIYGNSDPVFTYTASGFEAGDDESILTGALAREAGSGVGTYALNLGTLDAGPNYTINFVGSDFEITPATLNVTVFSGQQKTYGDPDPGFRFFATGFTNGDFGSIITGALSRAPAEDVGAYPINLGTVRAGPNYIINFIGADFEIIPAPLSITANPGQSKVYGEAEPSFTYTVSGLKNADTESVVTGSLTRVAGEDVGFYGIQLGAITAGNNYTINFTGANFAITEKTLDITVDAGQSKILGQVDPVFTYQVSGFENGDDRGTSNRCLGESSRRKHRKLWGQSGYT
jgi:FOG: PKD repeat